MSTSRFIVVRLDVPSDDEVASRAHALAQWLQSERILAPLAESEWGFDEHALGAWGPGSRWRTAAIEPLPDPLLNSPGEEVDISGEIYMHSAFANSEDYSCAKCGMRLPSDEAFGDLIVEWEARGEPTVRCNRCGAAALLGDWVSEHPPAVVGGPAVTFYRWPPLRTEFIAELIAKLGGDRCRAFTSHL
jgi:DNA-directed RNA polymerase subunit RPC12/RpoP